MDSARDLFTFTPGTFCWTAARPRCPSGFLCFVWLFLLTGATHSPVLFFFLLSLVCLFFRPPHIAAIPPLFWSLPQGVTVTVDHGEQHGPRRASPTVELRRGAQIQEGLESRVGAHLLAGGLVGQKAASAPSHRRRSSERLG